MLLQEAKEGELIIKENDDSNNKLYIVIRGKIAIVKSEDKNVYAVKEDESNYFHHLDKIYE